MATLLRRSLMAAVLLLITVTAGHGAVNPADYPLTSQADLITQRDASIGKKVQVRGTFLFTGSDFCYQIRKTNIVTKDYFCFALGTPSLVRLYLKKDHAQAEQLLRLKKGSKVTAYGTFDSAGADFNYLIVDEFTVEPAG